MTTFSTSWTNAAAAGSSADAALACVQAACNQWATLLQGSTNITVSVTIGDVGSAIATGGSSFYADAQGLYEPVAITKLQTGTDPNGAAADIDLTLSPNYVSQLYYDPTLSTPVPAAQIDAVSVFEHEIGHGLGINDLSGSTYDRFVQASGAGSVFTGSNAEAADGGAPVPLDSSKSHVEIATDLMYPTASYGVRQSISGIDIGILQDIGAPIATGRGDTITLGNAQAAFSGQDGNDFITAGSNAVQIAGNAGDDTIIGGSGADTLFGGQGDDSIVAGDASNLLFGNEGQDTVRAGNGGNVIVGGQDANDGADVITSGAGRDLIFGNGGDDTVAAGDGADSVVGGFGNDVLLGNQGNDLVLGNQGNDAIYGGSGDDTLYGGQGDDTLVGGTGNDLMFGDEGSNHFVFAQGDTGFASGAGTGDAVADFKTGADKLVFSQGPAATAANFGATAVASTNFGDIQRAAQSLIDAGDRYAFVADGVDGFLFADENGDKGIDDAVKLNGAATNAALSATDLVGGAVA